MSRLQIQDGCFLHPDTYEPLRSIEVVIIDSGTLSRNYYNDGKLVCWSYDCDFPDAAVTDKQAGRCIDCSKSIRTGDAAGRAPCKFFTKIKVAFPEQAVWYEIRLNALSLFSKEDSRMNLYKYIEHLERNREHVSSVLTEIYFVQHRDFYKMYFKPVRPLSEEELANVTRLSEAAQQEINPFMEQFMANQSHIIRGVTARYPRLDKPYRFDSKAGANGRSVPCEATEDGAKYELDFEMNSKQAKELYNIMQDAYTNASDRDKSWPKKLEMPFKKQEDGSFIGKASLKAAYSGSPTSPPDQFDAKNKKLGADFKLTTGSTINVAVELIPFKMASTGVSLRLRGVQVIKYLPYKPPSPFGEEEGFSADDESGSPFGEESSDDMFDSEESGSSNDFDDEEIEEKVKEPSKRKKKAEVVDDEDDDDIEDIIASWSDDD